MTEPAYIEHVTLTTGDARRSYRDEITDVTVIPELGALLDVALVAGAAGAPITRVPGYLLRATAEGDRALLASVLVEALPITTIGVATSSRAGAGLWRLLHKQDAGLPLATDPGTPPPAPWVGARLEAGILDHGDAAEWLGDFERCLAWAWLERKRTA